MEQILSKDNAKLKNWAKLKEQKHVNETNLVLLEGKRLVDDAFKRGVKFQAVCTDHDILENKFSCSVYKMPSFCLQSLCETKNPQGIVAVAEIKKQGFTLPKSNFLILDGISDPGNFGTIVRTAVACGFEIYALNCVDFRNSKVLRASMGTIFDAKICVISEDDLSKFNDFKIFSATMKGKNIFSLKNVPNQFGIVLGSEGHGLSENLKKMKFEEISLPMKNNVESLNVAISGGILMYFLTNKN